MKSFLCAQCGQPSYRATGGYNRSIKNGWPLYCSRACTFAAKRTGRGPGWHEKRFEPQPNAVQKSCEICARSMWLPPSKAGEYHTCGKQCAAMLKRRGVIARTRNCETCGRVFSPRSVQVANGGGRFCSHRCQPAKHLVSAENLARAQQARRDAQAAGLIDWKTGPDHHSWAGGKEASAERQRAPEKRRQRAAALKAYRAKNKHKVREWQQRRGKGKILSRLPWGTIPRIGEMQKWRCAICRVGIRQAYHLDHIEPIARGGKHVPRNLQLLCPSCNVRKSAKDPIAYMQELGRLL